MTIAKTTAIGSLPHHNVDAALAFSFQLDVPFLPQIPIRNPWEFMIAQALEGLPGLIVEKDGAVTLDIDVWTGRTHALNERLLNAFAVMAGKRDAFESFEPSSATSSSWQPFLWELEEREIKTAKIQLAGPLTDQWVLRLSDGSGVANQPDLTSQIYRLVLARALAMTRRLQAGGIQPILFLDEPGLYAYSASNPAHVLALQELKLLVQTLKREKVIVGVHCCSNTDWNAVLQLGVDYLSLDTDLSLGSLLESHTALETYLKEGGKLSLGVIPTSQSHGELGARSFDVPTLFTKLLGTFETRWKDRPELVRKVMSEALYTPACGLALHSVAEAEHALAALLEFGKFCKSSL